MSRKVNKFDPNMDLQWTDEISECPVYRPSKEEFDDPFLYLQNIAPQASKYGICKIVSPINARVPAGFVLSKEMKDFKFETIVQPLWLSAWDVNDKLTFFRRGRKYTYREFESMANKAFIRRFRCSGCLPCAAIEKEFWREMVCGRKGTVEYGLNVEGSAFSSDPNDPFENSKWNLKNLSRLPKSTLRVLERAIPGITDPMLYIGMLFSIFAWHVEDHFLYSINYHHSGAPKTWYGVPGDFALEFEKIVLDHVYSRDILQHEGVDGASKRLAEKTTMFPPNILLKNDVPVYKVLQMPGEFVVTFPRAYHSGFSHGFNCGEAVNFAAGDWFHFGAQASQRYALLRVTPTIPYEELVCKEAMLLYESLKHDEGLDHYSAADFTSHFSIKLSFVRLVRFYERVFWRLISHDTLTSLLSFWPTSQGTIICNLCKSDCYLACMMCNRCYSYSICLNHVWDAETHWVDCSSCIGSKCTVVFMREDISAYEEAAKRFEQEEQILRELVQQETKGSYSLYAKHKYCLKSTHITNNNPTDNEYDALCGVSFSTHP
ncbi:lysine-specific demethylase JMJ706 [Morus notabilis]|uniref:lysine-specific demethylase JMJ706 n=1 Tax=Morus notabilis TaxID=981085 RepID=UPI000CED1EBF|nr:lysine-specific demethylase JMJ706 [Morus notabilis]